MHLVLVNLSLNVIPFIPVLLLNHRGEPFVEPEPLTEVLAASLLLLRHFSHHLLFPLGFIVCLLYSCVSFTILVAVGLLIGIILLLSSLQPLVLVSEALGTEFLEVAGFGLHSV